MGSGSGRGACRRAHRLPDPTPPPCMHATEAWPPSVADEPGQAEQARDDPESEPAKHDEPDYRQKQPTVEAFLAAADLRFGIAAAGDVRGGEATGAGVNVALGVVGLRVRRESDRAGVGGPCLRLHV